MKLIVDKVPDKPYNCPYCKDKSCMDYEEYICTWNNSDRVCPVEYDGCPYFTEKQ